MEPQNPEKSQGRYIYFHLEMKQQHVPLKREKNGLEMKQQHVPLKREKKRYIGVHAIDVYIYFYP